MDADTLPLAGIKVVEFTHMVMGPSAGVILADLGADVIKVEPEGGDQTRRLLGSARDISRCSTATSAASASTSRPTPGSPPRGASANAPTS